MSGIVEDVSLGLYERRVTTVGETDSSLFACEMQLYIPTNFVYRSCRLFLASYTVKDCVKKN